MIFRMSLATVLIVLGSVMATAAQSQQVGQSTRVQFGVVRNVQEVSLDSNAARGAVVGGMLGIVSGSGSTSRRARNGIVGAGAGGALTNAAEGSRTGMSYTVEIMDGSSTTIVSDQSEIHEGDCVAIEQVGDTANIRRTSASYCNKTNQKAVSSVASHSTSEAVACEAAKQELANATTSAASDAASRKAELLCNG
jgi:hypothetical protein